MKSSQDKFEDELRTLIEDADSLEEINDAFDELDVIDTMRSEKHKNHYGKDVLKDYLEDGMRIKLSNNETFDHLESSYTETGFDYFSYGEVSILTLAMKYQIFNDLNRHIFVPYSKENLKKYSYD